MSKLTVIAALLLVSSLWGSGCAEPEVELGTGTIFSRGVAVDSPAHYTAALDLLFVVDNTAGMSAKQEELAASFQRLMNIIGYFDDPRGNPLNVQVGVVSTDMGVGAAHAVHGCTVAGDDGWLRQGQAMDIRVGEADQPLNFEGSVDDTFASMVTMGGRGCRFEQPLAAMKKAIERGAHLDRELVRPGAALAVVFLSNEDDCSVSDSEFFNPMLDGTGEVSKFRCFKHGVQCDDDVAVVGGQPVGCEPREDSPYILSVGSFVDFLRERKDPGSLIVSGVIGDSDVVEIERTIDGQLAVASYECDGVTESSPALRLQSFLEAFDDKGDVAPLCGSEPFGPLERTGRNIRKALGTSCLEGAIADVYPERPGRQPYCDVYVRHADQTMRTIPKCDALAFEREKSTEVPCYIIDEGHESCGDFTTQLSLDVWWGWDSERREKPQPAGSRLVAECLLEPDEVSEQAGL